jgi:hypothetical protein
MRRTARTTVQTKKPTRRVTKRDTKHGATHGGTVENVERIIRETEFGNNIHIINPNSKFVVITYWWGRGNGNRNLQYPCPEDIVRMAREEAIARLGAANPYPIERTRRYQQFVDMSSRRALRPSENLAMQSLQKDWEEWKARIIAANPNIEDIVNEIKVAVQARETTRPGGRPIRTFDEMIAEWEDYCRRTNVNYVSLNTEFPRADYQNGINGKPLFIKKVLDAVKPRGVLYIDGDMWMLKYPHICDMENIDFMARGWNIDCRSKEKALTKPYFDPYTFETSGGTMYFGNTQRARDLLDLWATESSKPEAVGKADDRILSQVFTTRSLVVKVNTIQLPIEYLWLTDNYKTYLKTPADSASLEDAIIEHPYCLTGDERATEQGAASNRTPNGYAEEVEENVKYDREPERFYEYIFFDGKENVRQEYDRYLKYLKATKNLNTRKPLLDIVDFNARYGEFNRIVMRNMQGLEPRRAAPGAVVRRRGGAVGDVPSVVLPLNTPIPEILRPLFEGKDVYLGEQIARENEEDEFVATDASTPQDGRDGYTRAIRINTEMPMFISSKNSMIRHLLLMCETLADINKHVGTYMFLSRIRWNTKKTVEKPKILPIVPAVGEGIDFRRVVNQIWFGADMPEWRRKMFELNKAVCEANGFEHKIWMNQDRNRENFPQTIAYQEAALVAGREIGQSRWAQVADLARLEIIYNVGGIYADSLVEISSALLGAIVRAINDGATFVGCNEDPCDPPLDCQNAQGQKYLTNSFFAATRGNDIFGRLLAEQKLDQIDMANEQINHTTGPYYLHSGITPQDRIFLFDSAQIFQFNNQETPYKPEPIPDRFLFRTKVPGSLKVKDDMYFLQGGLEVLQQEFIMNKKGPLAIYHSGLGGTWST